MNFRFIIWLIISIGLSDLQASEIRSDAEKIINETYPASSLSFIKQKIPVEIRQRISAQTHQKFYSEHVYLWKIYQRDSIAGLAILDNVYGKSQPITFLVILSADGTIKKTAIIRYREPYGGAVASQRWLNQFTGLSSSDKFSVNQEIDAISGATISVGSVTVGIYKLTLLWEYYLKNIQTGCTSSETVVEMEN